MDQVPLEVFAAGGHLAGYLCAKCGASWPTAEREHLTTPPSEWTTLADGLEEAARAEAKEKRDRRRQHDHTWEMVRSVAGKPIGYRCGACGEQRGP